MIGEPPLVKKVDKCMHKSVSLIVGGELAKVIFNSKNMYACLLKNFFCVKIFHESM